jgi:FG-GAP-like repeat
VVRLGNGDCTFGPEIGLAAGIRPSSMALADLDGDGILDLAVTTDEGQHLRTFHGNGDGSFSDRQELTVGGSPSLVKVTDWNFDGIPDLVASDGYLHLLLGTGHGQFAPAIDCAVGLGSPVIADFDQDGVVDVAVSNTILLGMHECNYTRMVTFPTPRNSALPLLAGDLNGDGALDLVFSSGDNVGLLPGDGQGGFGSVVMLGGSDRAERDQNYPTFAFAGDFNGDGRLDLAVNNDMGIRTFINTCQ